MKQTLWTIQHRNAYERLVETGVLQVNKDFFYCQKELIYAYDWMAEQMIARVGAPPPNVEYPVWAWVQWEGCRGRRDLRYAGYGARGTPMVQIEFEADEKDMLLSDFDDWHLVLNRTYIADSEKEFDDFYGDLGENCQQEIEASWQKVFELGRYTPGWNTPPWQKSIQATLWEVCNYQVKKVEFFTAK